MVLPGWRARQAPRPARRRAPCRRRRVGHGPMRGTRLRGTDNRISTGAPAGMTPVSGCGSVSGRLTVSRVRGMNSAWRFGAPENFSTRGLTPPGPPQVTRIQRPKIQSNVLATRKPTTLNRLPEGFPPRIAERTNHG